MNCPLCNRAIPADTTACPTCAEISRLQAAVDEIKHDLDPRSKYFSPYTRDSTFTLEKFATSVYEDMRFMLPAIYGGELRQSDKAYEALFIWEGPLISFTKQRWKRCDTVERAMERHREIFHEWAYQPGRNQAVLFDAFCSRTDPNFFKRFYITDIWKDGGRRTFEKYWIRQLRTEVREVPADHIVFVSDAAWKWKALLLDASGRDPATVHKIEEPWKVKGDYKPHVESLLQEMKRPWRTG